jgi:hypothetical protein
MTECAELDYQEDADVAEEVRSEHRMTILPTLMMAAIAGMVSLALIAEARLPPEQRLELLQAYAFPSLP